MQTLAFNSQQAQQVIYMPAQSDFVSGFGNFLVYTLILIALISLPMLAFFSSKKFGILKKMFLSDEKIRKRIKKSNKPIEISTFQYDTQFAIWDSKNPVHVVKPIDSPSENPVQIPNEKPFNSSIEKSVQQSVYGSTLDSIEKIAQEFTEKPISNTNDQQPTQSVKSQQPIDNRSDGQTIREEVASIY
jgi:hypothetical protein